VLQQLTQGPRVLAVDLISRNEVAAGSPLEPFIVSRESARIPDAIGADHHRLERGCHPSEGHRDGIEADGAKLELDGIGSESKAPYAKHRRPAVENDDPELAVIARDDQRIRQADFRAADGYPGRIRNYSRDGDRLRTCGIRDDSENAQRAQRARPEAWPNFIPDTTGHWFSRASLCRTATVLKLNDGGQTTVSY
jgi:hypothetical protein